MPCIGTTITPTANGPRDFDISEMESSLSNSAAPRLVEELKSLKLALGMRATDWLAAAHEDSQHLLTPKTLVTGGQRI